MYYRLNESRDEVRRRELKMRLKKAESLKKEQDTFTIPQMVKRQLATLDNKSEVVTELLLDNMDRISDGDIMMAKKMREAQVRGYIAECMQQEASILEENSNLVQQLQELVRGLQELRSGSKEVKESLHGVDQEAKKILKSLKENNVQEQLVNNICSKLYEDTESMVEELFEV